MILPLFFPNNFAPSDVFKNKIYSFQTYVKIVAFDRVAYKFDRPRNFWDPISERQAWPPYPRFLIYKRVQLTGSWLRSIVWFYSGKNDSIKSILFLLFISDLAMVTCITEVFKTFWWQASVFWFKKAVEKLAISHEKLQKWIGREGKFPMREDEFMKISDQHIILIGKGNLL